MNKLLFILPVFLLAFTSCEQNANIDMPEVKPELVISCFITPQDSFIRARVSLSTPVFESNANNGQPISNATVTLYGNSSSVSLIYNSVTQLYEATTAAFPIIAGNEYHIIVSEPSGLTADAFTTVPLAPPAGLAVTATDTVSSTDPWGMNGEVRYEYSFNDPSGQTDYYRIIDYGVYWNQFSMDTSLQRQSWELFSDENADGTTIANNYTSWFYMNGDSLVAFEIYFLHCNYEYYSFHRSIENYSGGDPFSEPTLIFDNVTNGLGIFAAANAIKVRIWR